ncbi:MULTISPECIES: glycoside hydrolase family 3 N-terminal domain-containing protein [unclassified Microbacterium]|uniref:glycoside hydrolase family 3 N-terminal domain-containing protein n=1 Tax=unclassified Microbacterium TaxID=2609290 RepID=UPI00214C75DC|nr:MULTISPECIES: glycoside hydrolase family 3 N-terminal domain-containing protein [unclassified Microbacterium]MCR2785545.1 glycoside hydrolase family 3 protein [Microbacterium sp. zg.B96]WIM17467.1 glycoside hydrolase family 3 N-terminal domain-containing protein [Microbacterium sp. zg-B96]
MRRVVRIVGVAACAVTLGLVMPAAASGAGAGAGSGSTVTVTSADDAAVSARADRLVAEMSARERAASVVMGHIPTTDPAVLRDYMAATGLGGFILMGSNIPADEAALRAVTESLSVDPALPPLIGIDEEGDDVTRLPWDDYPGAVTLKDAPAAATTDAFAGRGALLQRAGVNVNFGIVGDVPADSGSFIFRRALGTMPQPSAERVTAAVTGEAGAVASTLKHFPGHGAAPGDSHHMLPTTDLSREEWEQADAAPFRAGIDAGAQVLMFGHLVYTAVDPTPATLSAEWHRVAREDLGFDGVSITDDLGMLQNTGDPRYADPVATAVAAIAAGNDMVMAVMLSDAGTAGRIVDGIAAAADSGALAPERLAEAATRVTELRLQHTPGALLPCADCQPAD